MYVVGVHIDRSEFDPKLVCVLNEHFADRVSGTVGQVGYAILRSPDDMKPQVTDRVVWHRSYFRLRLRHFADRKRNLLWG